MTYFHVPAPLLQELTELLSTINATHCQDAATVNRAVIALTALRGVNANPGDDNTHCQRRA